MDLRIFVFVYFAAFGVQGGIISSDGDSLKRVARSPYCHVCEDSQQFELPPPPPPPHGRPPPPPPLFRSQQWSGFTANGNQQGVFSGASAAVTDGPQASGAAFSIASADADYKNTNQLNEQAGSKASAVRGDLEEQQQQSSGFGNFNANSNRGYGGSDVQKLGYGSNRISGNSGGSFAQSAASSSSFSGSGHNSGLSGGQEQQRLESGNFHGSSGLTGGQATQNLEQGNFQSNGQLSGRQTQQHLESGHFEGHDSSFQGGQSQQQVAEQFNSFPKGPVSSGFSSSSSGSGAQSGYGGPRQLETNSNSEASNGFSGDVQQSSQGARSTLQGALDLAKEGLQSSQQTSGSGCSTCGRSSYALSNAKSNSGSAVAVSVNG